jgi:hypothetical protein
VVGVSVCCRCLCSVVGGEVNRVCSVMQVSCLWLVGMLVGFGIVIL